MLNVCVINTTFSANCGTLIGIHRKLHSVKQSELETHDGASSAG